MGKFRAAQRWLEERFKLRSLVDFFNAKTVPVHRHTAWYYLGNVLITFFFIQVITGFALLFYYRATPEAAYESVRSIILEVPFGWLIRSVHSWSANLMVAAAGAHLFSTFFLRAYRKPRELTWITGALMFFAVLGIGFSGYLLPWNELSYFATKVGTGIAGQTPLIGGVLKAFLRGGENVGAGTLTRFFALHVVILPMVLVVMAAVHLFFIQVQGMSVPEPLEDKKDGLESIKFFPDFILRDAALACIQIAIVVALAVLFPWELGKKADTMLPTPEGIRPEWFFLFMFKTLELIPSKIGPLEGEKLGIIFFIAAFSSVLLIPFLDRCSGGRLRKSVFKWGGIIALCYIFIMTLWAVLPSVPIIHGKIDESGTEELQRALAHRYIPELVIFIVLAAALALGLKAKSDDLRKLRKEKFFRKPDEPSKEGS